MRIAEHRRNGRQPGNMHDHMAAKNEAHGLTRGGHHFCVFAIAISSRDWMKGEEEEEEVPRRKRMLFRVFGGAGEGAQVGAFKAVGFGFAVVGGGGFSGFGEGGIRGA